MIADESLSCLLTLVAVACSPGERDHFDFDTALAFLIKWPAESETAIMGRSLMNPEVDS